MVGGFALSSISDETPKTPGVSAEVQLTREKQPPLLDKKGQFSQKKPTRSENTDDRTRGIKEWRAKRKKFTCAHLFQIQGEKTMPEQTI